MYNSIDTNKIQAEIDKNKDSKYRLKYSETLGLISTTDVIEYKELSALPNLSKSTINLIKRFHHLLEDELKKGISVQEALRILKEKIKGLITSATKPFIEPHQADHPKKIDDDVKQPNLEINILSFILSKFFSRILKQQQLSIVK